MGAKEWGEKDSKGFRMKDVHRIICSYKPIPRPIEKDIKGNLIIEKPQDNMWYNCSVIPESDLLRPENVDVDIISVTGDIEFRRTGFGITLSPNFNNCGVYEAARNIKKRSLMCI